jgi:phage shock protein E
MTGEFLPPMKTLLLTTMLTAITTAASADAPPPAPNETAKKVAEEKKPAVQHVDAAAAAKLLSAKEAKVTVLDIRTPDEFVLGHVDGAVNINFTGGKFAGEIAKLDKTKRYLLHCQSGARSKKSLEAFEKAGFTSIIHLDGGFAAWQKAGLPVKK